MRNKIDPKDLLNKFQKIEKKTDERDKIRLMVDIFWPHPMTTESQVLEHKCHKMEFVEFPNLMSINNEYLTKKFSEMFKDPYTKKSQLVKMSVLYNEWLYPEKIVVVLNSPLRQNPLTPDDLKNEVLDKRKE